MRGADSGKSQVLLNKLVAMATLETLEDQK